MERGSGARPDSDHDASDSSSTRTTGTTPATAAPPPTDTLARPTGTLRSGDLLKIRVYRDSELSGEYLINAQGDVQIPGVGVIRAAGLDPTQISERLVEAFRARGFRTPEIAVQPLIRVSVLGEVRTPGLYPVEPGVTLYSNDVVYLPPRHTVFSRDNITLAATLAALALSVVTLIQVTHH